MHGPNLARRATVNGVSYIPRQIVLGGGGFSARYPITRPSRFGLGQESRAEAVRYATLCYAHQAPVLGSITTLICPNEAVYTREP
jgi:hypothetical protein